MPVEKADVVDGLVATVIDLSVRTSAESRRLPRLALTSQLTRSGRRGEGRKALPLSGILPGNVAVMQ
jgi:hypothetical protein